MGLQARVVHQVPRAPQDQREVLDHQDLREREAIQGHKVQLEAQDHKDPEDLQGPPDQEVRVVREGHQEEKELMDCLDRLGFQVNRVLLVHQVQKVAGDHLVPEVSQADRGLMAEEDPMDFLVFQGKLGLQGHRDQLDLQVEGDLQEKRVKRAREDSLEALERAEPQGPLVHLERQDLRVLQAGQDSVAHQVWLVSRDLLDSWENQGVPVLRDHWVRPAEQEQLDYQDLVVPQDLWVDQEPLVCPDLVEELELQAGQDPRDRGAQEDCGVRVGSVA